MEHVFGKHRSEGSHSSSVASTSKLFLYCISDSFAGSEGIFGGNITKANDRKIVQASATLMCKKGANKIIQ